MHAYWGVDFFQFFWVLLKRIPQLLMGASPAPDEVQLLVLMAVAISSAVVGSYLMLRRLTMLANSLSHTVLLGIVLAYLLFAGFMGPMLAAALLTALLTAGLTQFLHRTLRLQEDASIGLVFSLLFALGIVLATLLTRNAHIGLEAVMGNVDALQASDLGLVTLVLAGNLLLTLLFFRQFQITTFDPGHAASLGIRVGLFHYILVLQAAATVVGSFRAVGVVMVLSFLVGPPLTAKLLCKSLRGMLLLASLIGCLAALLGVALSRHLLSLYALPLSTGGVTVCIVAAIYLATLLPRFARTR